MTATDSALLDQVRARLATVEGEVTPHRVAEAMRASGHPVGDSAVLAVYEVLRRESRGAGLLQPLLSDPAVTDVLVNGPDAVYVDRGNGPEPVDVAFADEAAVRRLAVRLAAHGGRRLDDAQPFVDVRLPDGTRCHVVLSPVARPGTVISLRTASPGRFGLDDLVPVRLVEWVERIVATRLAFLVSGGTGSGKTSLLAALLESVEPEARIVIVEDSSELRPHHPHVVSLEARTANAEGAGTVTMQTLVRQALRMRPDRLVVGEVRGAEVTDMLAAMNTGHEGGCGTVHANSADDVPTRIEALALAAGAFSREAVHAQLASAVSVVLHMSRGPAGRRRLAQIGVVDRQGELARVRRALTVQGERVREGPGLDRLRRLLGDPQ